MLELAFIKPTNITFERYKLLSRKQKDRESYEQFWGALSDLARSCEIGINAEQEWIRDVFIFNMKNCDLQRRLLSETLNPLDALNQAIIDEKGYYNHLKLTNMTRSFITTGNSGRGYKNFNNVKKEPSLNIERSNTCMKCGNAFTKGHLNVCPAKEIVCNICKYKGHFGRLCKSKGRKPAVNTVDESVYIGLGDDAIVNLNIPVDSASPVSFLKQNVLHELKLRNPHLKIQPVEKKTRELYCGFTNDTINIIGKVVVRLQSNGWTADETPFFITSGHERNILGNDNLPRIGIEIAQRQPLLPVNNISRPELYKGKSIISKDRAQDWGADDAFEDGYLEDRTIEERGYESDPANKEDRNLQRAPLSNPFSHGAGKRKRNSPCKRRDSNIGGPSMNSTPTGGNSSKKRRSFFTNSKDQPRSTIQSQTNTETTFNIPTGTSDDPIRVDSSPEKTVETPKTPISSKHRVRRNPGPPKFFGERRFIDQVTLGTETITAVDSDDEPLITFSGAKSPKQIPSFCTTSPSDYLTPIDEIPRHTILAAETTQDEFSTPSSQATRTAWLSPPLVEGTSNTQDDIDSDISSGIDTDVRIEADNFHTRYNSTVSNSENF